jgi:hypothetical protein
MFILAAIASCTTVPSSGAGKVAAGEVPLSDAQGRPLVTVRVSQAVLDAGDPRYRPEDKGFSRYAADNDPWRWTREQRVLASALDLRDLLTRMLCGADADLSYGPSLQYDALGSCTGVEIAAWTGPEHSAASLLVGRPDDFGLRERFDPVDPYTREQRRIRVAGGQVQLLGDDSAGVELAVWDFAHALGYRYFLPSKTWEIVPDHRGKRLVAPALDERRGHEPGYRTRRLTGPLARQPGYEIQAWSTRNGFAGSLQTLGVQGQWGHIYEADQAWYDSHPESTSASSRPSVRGRSPGVKFCPDYRDERGQDVASRIYQQWAEPKLQITDPSRYDMHLTRDHLPLHHGDNTWWAGCAPEHQGGEAPADRALLLAGRVAQLAREDGVLGERMVGVMAYREVFPGPLRARADPAVFVYLVGNGYMGVPFEEALEAWKRAGTKHLGLYAYWDANLTELPQEGGPQAPVATAAMLAEREQQGLRSLWIESGGAWGPSGLFRWALLRIARDTTLARTDPQAAVERELALVLESFPPDARAPVRGYLERLDISDGAFLLSPDLVADLYRSLAAARKATIRAKDAQSQSRVEDLLVYTRHLELYWLYREGSGSYNAWIEHAACVADRGVVDYDLLWSGISGADTPARKAYRAAHGGKDPKDVVRNCTLDFEAWIRGAPDRQLGPETAWYAGREGGYALPTRFPGTADAGAQEGRIHGNPRDTVLWRVWLENPVRPRLSSACHGVMGVESETPAKNHVTSRLLGRASVELRRDGELVCEAALPPTRQAWDLAFGRDAQVRPSGKPAGGSTCLAEPRALSLDTGQAEPPEVSCEGRELQPGLYEVVTRNHRSGFDHGALEGARGVSRWDSPFVLHEQRRPETGAASRYFYVPKGTTKVAIYSGGSACKVLRDARPAHQVDLTSSAPGYHVIDTKTPDGVAHDGEIWGMRGCADAWLVNVPPVVAPRRELLMAPCDKVGDPGWEPLGLDASSCQ